MLTINTRLLSKECSSGRMLAQVNGVIIHYFSACNVETEKKYFDIDACFNLMEDLNRPRVNRTTYMREQIIWPDARSFASAHYFIGRDGDITQLLHPQAEAWHAGASMLNGRPHCNKWTLGIELIGHAASGFSREQYTNLAELLIELEHRYHFPRENIVGHDTVRHEAISAGIKATHKYDPSGAADGQGDNFDWFYLGKLMNDIKPNPAGVVSIDQLDDVIAADPLSGDTCP